ncbi:MAG: LPS export ABC transporter periplasmic protein LptC [Muribaculaceae bacterium]|nr:LPS export ABC transporter periplasmic protein LptC [Muribaculaceae bacterium]
MTSITGKGKPVYMRLLPVAAALFMAMSAVTSCKEDKQPLLSGNTDPETFPTMKTLNVSTLISDSGVTRYKITSPIWYMFDQAKTPVWKFPKGLHLEKYDDFFRIEATVECDSATYFKNQQIWRLDGYVRIANVANEKFLTPQLFWDQRGQKIYSDSFIHIEKTDRIIEGYGFESNDKLTNYKVLNVSGIFPVDRFRNNNGGADSTQSTAPMPQPVAADTITATPASAAPNENE